MEKGKIPPSGIPIIDAYRDSIPQASLTLFNGPVGSGVSAVMRQWAVKARQEGANVLFVNTEEDVYACWVKHLAAEWDKPLIWVKALPVLEYAQAVEERRGCLAGGAWLEYFSPALGRRGWKELKEDVERLCKEHKSVPDIVFIDTMRTLAGPEKAMAARDVLSMTRSLRLPFVVSASSRDAAPSYMAEMTYRVQREWEAHDRPLISIRNIKNQFGALGLQETLAELKQETGRICSI